MERVTQAAGMFRTAIERTPTGLTSLANFPLGACGDASEMLGEYLRECGLGNWDYHSGLTRDGRSHGWIEQNGLIVDITADRFDGWGAPPVMVTIELGWHQRYFPSRLAVHRAGLNHWTGPSHADAVRTYGAIRAAAEALRSSEA